MEKIGKNEFEKLESISADFIKNVVSISGKSSEDARKAFVQAANLMTVVKMVTTKFRYKRTDPDNYEKRAKLLVQNCELALPVLKKVYGEPLLNEAMQKISERSRPVARLAKRMGGPQISNLIHKSLPPAHDWI